LPPILAQADDRRSIGLKTGAFRPMCLIMISPVTVASATSTLNIAGRATAPANLDADLAKAQGQLADWVACPSCKTPEGKAKIEEISAKVDTIKSKLKAVEDSKPTRAEAAKPPSAEAAAQSPGVALSTLGGFVDTYA
jgi:hypothetical protein